MYEDDDDFDQPQVKTPPLPRELRDSLFDYSEPDLPAVRYSAIGPEKWPATVGYGAKRGFTTWRNPRAQEARIFFNLGPDAHLHVRFEMDLIPAAYRIPRGVATERLKMGQPLRREYNRLVVRIPPGASVALPAVFDNAVRTPSKTDATLIVGGEAPFLVKVIDGDDETDPPQLHSSLMPSEYSSDAQPQRQAAARRRS